MESQSRFFGLSPIIMHGICLESAFHSSTNFGGYGRMIPHGCNSFKLERACFSRSSFRNVEIVKICVFVLLACSMMLETFETPMELAQSMIMDAKDSLVIFELEEDTDGDGDFDDFI